MTTLEGTIESITENAHTKLASFWPRKENGLIADGWPTPVLFPAAGLHVGDKVKVTVERVDEPF